MSSTGVLVFSGYNQRAVVAFLRTLESNGVPYAIIASKPDDTISLTDYKKRIAATRNRKELDLNDLSRCIGEAKQSLGVGHFVIAPSTEALNRYLIDNREAFEKLNCSVPLVGKRLYEQVSDKHSFGKLCSEVGILVPVEYESLGQAKVPFVAKPKTYFSSDGGVYTPVIIHTESDVDAFKSHHREEDFYYQEYVEGESHYLLYYFYRDGSRAKSSQQNYIQQPGGKSMVAATISDFHEDPESQKYEELFRSVGFTGLVMVEVKRQADNHYMIEANPRFWGPSQLFVDAGMNFFESMLYDNDLIDSKPEFPDGLTHTDYFWFGGIAETIQSGGLLTYHTISSEDLAKNLSSWLGVDVYNRDDTRELFIKEVGINNDN